MNKVLLGVKLCFFCRKFSRATPAACSGILYSYSSLLAGSPWKLVQHCVRQVCGRAGATPATGRPFKLHSPQGMRARMSATLNSHNEGPRAASQCPSTSSPGRSTEQGVLHHAGIIPPCRISLLSTEDQGVAQLG